MIEIFKNTGKLKSVKNLWLGLYLLKATLALLFVVPFFLSINAGLSSSEFSRTLVSSWDISVMIEMFFGRGEIIPLYLLFISMAVIVYALIMQYVNGGLYYLFVSGRIKEINWHEFFAECGLRFNIHIKITVFMAIVYFLLFMAAMFVVNIIGVAGGHLIGTPALILMIFKMIIIFLVLLAASIFSDSVRASAAAYPEKQFGELLKIASSYFRPAMGKLVRIYIITYLPFLAIWALTEWLSLQSVGLIGGFLGIFIEFILFQLASSVRTGQKLWYLICFGGDFHEKHEGRFLPQQAKLAL
jgi:hypothetical protein